MDVVHGYDKLKRVLQLCNVSNFMSEYGCSVITERLKEALTSGKHFHEQNVKDVIDSLQKDCGCGTTSLGSYYLHMDLHTGTCSWLSILKGERSKWFHILASTYSASKSTWKSSGLHGWCETCSIKMANCIVCVFIQTGRQPSLKEYCFTSPTHSDNYPLTNIIPGPARAGPQQFPTPSKHVVAHASIRFGRAVVNIQNLCLCFLMFWRCGDIQNLPKVQ